MTMTTGALQNNLNRIIQYLHPFSSFINCHMVNYLTEDHWKAFVPQAIQDEIQSKEDIEKAIDIFWNPRLGSASFPHLVQYIEEKRKFTMDDLTDIWQSPEEVVHILSKIGCSVNETNDLEIKEFMSEKKNHEVKTAAQLVSILSTFDQKDNDRLPIIDAGDGKGYLSSRLALEYKLSVLGIDANPDNTENALKRKARLEKAWNGLTKRAQDVQNGIVPPRKGKRKGNTNNQLRTETEIYKTTTHYITPETDFVALFGQYFPSECPSGFCLSGLHTCGNLASSCLQIFVENKNVNALCNVGCCYHLLCEEFRQDEFFDNRKVRTMTTNFGFPMSSFLKDLKFSLGRNARMLGAQSIHRTRSNKDLPNETLFYRAVLEKLISKMHPDLQNCVQVGRIKKAENFIDYARTCSRRKLVNLDSVSDAELLVLEQSFEHQRHELNLFYLLRMAFAPIIETVILLDRLLYLRENQIGNSFLVQLFDPIVSPRCFGIMAVKTR